MLASPELIARTITAVHRENSAAEDTEIEEGDVIEALGALDPVWDELYPAEQARIMRLLIERINVESDGISVTLHAAGVRSIIAGAGGPGDARSGLRAGALFALGLVPVEFIFWIGFALPAGPVFGLARTVLVAMGWPRHASTAP